VLMPMIYNRTASMSVSSSQEFQLLYARAQTTIMALSPLFGPLASLQVLNYCLFPRQTLWHGIVFAVGVKLLLAMILLQWTIKTFDRCMGRVPEKLSFRPQPCRSTRGGVEPFGA
jgi:hypothetical protein